uniref:Mucin-5AC-like n=1 Tax=Petromyzon marinus TaxID=7757 RepID=A0AAJ7U584_PETMA|nr:mucin-5AC-like [Petromyzon marinus]XP_032829959.1 mucin-5AC-like [Petromyzon marinus]XP_032829960.1 mucin-5AC-like [Petromyzon marinus]
MAGGGSLTAGTGALLPLGAELFRTLSGLLIVAEMVFGGLVWILVASTNLKGTDLSQGWVMFVSVTFFVFTIVQFVLYIISVPSQTSGWVTLNAWFNLAAFVLYLSAAVLQANVTACTQQQCWLMYSGQSPSTVATTMAPSTVPTVNQTVTPSLNSSVTGSLVPTSSLTPVAPSSPGSPTASHTPSTVTTSVPSSVSTSTVVTSMTTNAGHVRKRRGVPEPSYLVYPNYQLIRLLIRSVREQNASANGSSTMAMPTTNTSSVVTTTSPTDNDTYRINVAATVFSYLATFCYAINAYVGMGMWKNH